MKKLLYLVLTFLVASSVSGQNKPAQTASGKKDIARSFEMIDPAYDLSQKERVATLREYSINSGKNTLAHVFRTFWASANEKGANSFTVDSVWISHDTTHLILGIYNLSEAELTTNFNLYPQNMVYVIGDIDKNQTTKTIKFNKVKVILQPMEYLSYQNKVGEDAIISIGGFSGAKVWIRGSEGRLPKHLSVTGFGVGPGSSQPLSLSFNTGRVYPVDLNFGQFLVSVLKESKIGD